MEGKGRDGLSLDWLGALAIVLLAHGAVLLGYSHWHRKWPHPGPPAAMEITLVAPLAPVERSRSPQPAPPAPHRPAPTPPPRPPAPTPVAAPQATAAAPQEQTPPAPPATNQAPAPPATPHAPAPPVTAQAPVLSTAISAQPGWEPPQFAPAYLHNPPPGYPTFARRHGMEGRVLLSARVGADGTCLEVKVARGSGYPVLDQAAVKAVRNWRFVPAQRGGKAEPAWVEIPIVFKLKD